MRTQEKTGKTVIADNPGRNGKGHPGVRSPVAGARTDLPDTSGERPQPSFLDRVVLFFSSLRLTVVLLGLGLILVFAGTIAQVELGTFKAQNEFFRGFFIYWGPKGANWKLPVFPGGYFVGGLLLLNLVAAHFTRFKWTRKKAGIWLTHVGVILLLVGQLLTDLLSQESSMHIREGEAKNYSEVDRDPELAIVDSTAADYDQVVAIPHHLLQSRKEIQTKELPFKIRVREFFINSEVRDRAPEDPEPAAATRGKGTGAVILEKPKVTDNDMRDVPSAVVEFSTAQGSLGTWLVSEYVNGMQPVVVDGKKYLISMRPKRIYKPFTLELLKFQHDVYPGTSIPKNFSSRVLLDRPSTGEKREVLIYMNTPLRYAGETFYQASFDKDDHGTVLQVVHNPSWLTPYLSCIMVGAGLVVQFMTHLIGFAGKRKAKA
jgi:hypothetical protein